MTLPARHIPSLWEPSLQVRFEQWLTTDDGQAVYEHIRARAMRLYERGWRHFGIAALWEAARYDRALEVGPDAEGWKVNNSWRSRLARRLMEDEPRLRGFFGTRELTA
jgi:hypothetical protein